MAVAALSCVSTLSMALAFSSQRRHIVLNVKEAYLSRQHLWQASACGISRRRPRRRSAVYRDVLLYTTCFDRVLVRLLGAELTGLAFKLCLSTAFASKHAQMQIRGETVCLLHLLLHDTMRIRLESVRSQIRCLYTVQRHQQVPSLDLVPWHVQ